MYTGIKHNMSNELAGIYGLEIQQTMNNIKKTPSCGAITDKYNAMDKQEQIRIDKENKEQRKEDEALQRRIKNNR